MSWASFKVGGGVRTAVALGVILMTGAVLRFHGVQNRTLNHPEVYAPGIDLPRHLSNPNPRFTLAQTLKGTIAGEPHPPGYYIVMLGWTKVFGSSILALRLPSVLFGVASIFLVCVLAGCVEDTRTALLASAMLALNGLHVFWSQTARMYSMACFLGLLSTVLLVILIRTAARSLTYRVLYVVVTVAGLATHLYVWPLFITQAVWVFAANLRAKGTLPGLLRLQLFTFVVATPLVAIAVYQSGAPARPETLNPLEGVLRFLQFGSLFEMDRPGVSEASANAVAAILALLATALLLGSAFLRKRDGQATDHQFMADAEGCGSPPRVATAVVGVLMTVSILLFAYVAKTLLPGRSTRLVIASSVLPIALVLLDLLLCGYRERFKSPPTILANQHPWPATLRSLTAFLAVLPVGMVAAASVFNPIFLQRGTLIFVPYLLVVLASGLASLVRRDRRWVALALILAGIHGLSLFYFKSKPPTYDYKTLAQRWVSQIEDSDLIFVHGRGHPQDWVVAPIFYYLNAERYHYIGHDFVNAVQNHPRSRVWLLSFPLVRTEREVLEALAGYQLRKRLSARGIFAKLYVPKQEAN